jgi:hypothetical protein
MRDQNGYKAKLVDCLRHHDHQLGVCNARPSAMRTGSMYSPDGLGDTRADVAPRPPPLESGPPRERLLRTQPT